MSALLPGREQSYMHAESKRTVERHLVKLVKNGLLPESALAAVRDANMQDGIPTIHKGRTEYYYKHLPSIFPGCCFPTLWSIQRCSNHERLH